MIRIANIPKSFVPTATGECFARARRAWRTRARSARLPLSAFRLPLARSRSLPAQQPFYLSPNDIWEAATLPRRQSTAAPTSGVQTGTLGFVAACWKLIDGTPRARPVSRPTPDPLPSRKRPAPLRGKAKARSRSKRSALPEPLLPGIPRPPAAPCDPLAMSATVCTLASPQSPPRTLVPPLSAF